MSDSSGWDRGEAGLVAKTLIAPSTLVGLGRDRFDVAVRHDRRYKCTVSSS